MHSKPLLIAHRGASYHQPENTSEAILYADTEFAADAVEFDVRMTRDKIPVILHDSHLQRMTNCPASVSELNFDEISKLDAAYHHDPLGDKTFPLRGRGIQIPAFDRVISVLKTAPAVEIKEFDPQLIHHIAGKCAEFFPEHVLMLGSKDHRVAQFLDAHYPQYQRFCSKKEIIETLLRFAIRLPPRKKREGLIYSLPPQSGRLNLHHPRWIDYLHRSGARVFFWTIDDEETMRLLAAHGADGLVTNRMDIAKKVFS